jgi:4-hydroxymandelate oxidase
MANDIRPKSSPPVKALPRRDFLRLGASTMGATLAGAAWGRAATGAGASAPSATLADFDLRRDCLTLDDVEARAKAVLSATYYDYFASGAGDEITVRWNRERYGEIPLFPRVLNDVSAVDCGVTILGHRHATPVLIAPSSNQMLAHPEGEIATVRAAGITGTTTVLSSAANTDIPEVLAAATQPVWFQLYIQHDPELTADMVRRAEAAGCSVLCVTVDSPVDGLRNRQTRLRLRRPPGVGFPIFQGRNTVRPSLQTLEAVRPQKLDWAVIDWLRSLTKMPVVLKGVMHPDSARRALDHGVAGIIVSNHGGRALDTVPATIDLLPAVAQAVAGRIPVLVDGGIRRGADVAKALALGANAVLVGRPIIYGLAAGGTEGVAHVLRILRMELLSTMALCGVTKPSELGPDLIWRRGS